MPNSAGEGSAASEQPTFGFLIEGMLKNPDHDTMLQVAEECCRKCGLPSDCTCVEELIESPAWIRWPNAATVIAESVLRMNRGVALHV